MYSDESVSRLLLNVHTAKARLNQRQTIPDVKSLCQLSTPWQVMPIHPSCSDRNTARCYPRTSYTLLLPVCQQVI